MDVCHNLPRFPRLSHHNESAYQQSDTFHNLTPPESIICVVHNWQLLVLVASALFIAICRQITVCSRVLYSTGVVMSLVHRALVFFRIRIQTGVELPFWRLQWGWMPFTSLFSGVLWWHSERCFDEFLRGGSSLSGSERLGSDLLTSLYLFKVSISFFDTQEKLYFFSCIALSTLNTPKVVMRAINELEAINLLDNP